MKTPFNRTVSLMMHHSSFPFQIPASACCIAAFFFSSAWKEKYSYNFEGVTITDIINRPMLLNYFIYTVYNICPFLTCLT